MPLTPAGRTAALNAVVVNNYYIGLLTHNANATEVSTGNGYSRLQVSSWTGTGPKSNTAAIEFGPRLSSSATVTGIAIYAGASSSSSALWTIALGSSVTWSVGSSIRFAAGAISFNFSTT